MSSALGTFVELIRNEVLVSDEAFMSDSGARSQTDTAYQAAQELQNRFFLITYAGSSC